MTGVTEYDGSRSLADQNTRTVGGIGMPDRLWSALHAQAVLAGVSAQTLVRKTLWEALIGEVTTVSGELDLSPIERREWAATPGPWHGSHRRSEPNGFDDLGCVGIGDYGWVASGGEQMPHYGEDSVQGHADAEFIAHARTDIPALVAEVWRLRAAR